MSVDVLAMSPVRNLPPESTYIVDDSHFVVEDDDGSERHFNAGVVHIRGVEQLDSAYGISPLEAFLPYLMTLRVLERAASAADQMLQTNPAPPTEIQEWARVTIEQKTRVEVAAAESVRGLMAAFVPNLPEPPSDLYFDGYEFM
jgi:hypothetical protein